MKSKIYLEIKTFVFQIAIHRAFKGITMNFIYFISLYPLNYYRVTDIIKLFYYQVLFFIQYLALCGILQRKVFIKHTPSSFEGKKIKQCMFYLGNFSIKSNPLLNYVFCCKFVVIVLYFITFKVFNFYKAKQLNLFMKASLKIRFHFSLSCFNNKKFS